MMVSSEKEAWREVPDGWRPLFGDVEQFGLGVEWHDFRTTKPFDWGQTFHRESVEFCVNFDGHGAVAEQSAAQRDYRPGTAGYYCIADEPLAASRHANERHQFVTFEFTRSHLQKQLEHCEDELDAGIRDLLFSDKRTLRVSAPQPITHDQRKVVGSLLQPPVPKAAQALWYQSKALELMSHFLFTAKDPELFCMRHKRIAHERVERAKDLLARNLSEPPGLEALGQEVGCSPFHLSRIFSREVGLTIPQYLRKLRMEKAAELLRTGRYNVTEAATEVGYSSLSHFSKAFCETIGCCPVLYPSAKNVILDR
jgi:AraC family transcriptional regulator